MGKIYVGQTALRIQLSTGIDLTDITVSIKYEKPDGTTGVWQASKLNDSGTIYYDINTVTDLDQSGDWTFWALLHYKMVKLLQENQLQFQYMRREHNDNFYSHQ